MKEKVIIIIHTCLQLFAFTSWLWLDYRLVTILATLHLIMLEALRGCPLSHSQFPDDHDKRFYEWWLDRLGLKLAGKRRKRVRIFMQYILPLMIIGLAILVQVIIGFKPLITM
jgi:hypothetical protein